MKITIRKSKAGYCVIERYDDGSVERHGPFATRKEAVEEDKSILVAHMMVRDGDGDS